MAYMLTKAALGAVAALMISGTAQAQYYGGGGYGYGPRRGYYGGW